MAASLLFVFANYNTFSFLYKDKTIRTLITIFAQNKEKEPIRSKNATVS